MAGPAHVDVDVVDAHALGLDQQLTRPGLRLQLGWSIMQNNFDFDKQAQVTFNAYDTDKKACDNGDMTRDGLLNAKQSIKGLDSDGLTGNLDFSIPGSPSSREGYILTVDKSKPGGLGVKQELTESARTVNEIDFARATALADSRL